MVKYSIVMSIYNTLPIVKRSVDAVMASMGAEAELLLVNNHPPYPEVINYLNSLQHPQVKVLDPGQNLGCHLGNHFALERSQGQYLVKLDDDIVVPQSPWLEDMYRSVEEFNLAYVALPWVPDALSDLSSGEFVEASGYRLNFYHKLIFFGCIMIRRDLWQQHFVYTKPGLYGGEEPFYARKAEELSLRKAYLVNHPVEHIGRSEETDFLYGVWKVLYAYKYQHPMINDFGQFKAHFQVNPEVIDILRRFGYPEQDISKLNQLHLQRPLKVLAVVPALIPSVDIGVAWPLSRLAAQGAISWELKVEPQVNAVDIAQSDVVVFQRNADPSALTWLRLAKNLGKGIIYDLDDNFFALAEDSPFDFYYSRLDVRLVIREFLKQADLVKVTSQALKDIAIKYNPNVEIHHYAIDKAQLINLPRRGRNPDQCIIGYAGTVHHDKDFQPVLPALRRILDEYGHRVVIEFMGLIPEELRDHPQVQTTEYNADFSGYLKELWYRNWDIGLAPLENTAFNRAKSPVKVREYGACSVAGIYSNNEVYQTFVQQLETGYLTEHNTEAWYQALKTLIDNPSLRETMGVKASQRVDSEFGPEKVDEEWKQIFSRFSPQPQISPQELATQLRNLSPKPTRILGVVGGFSPTAHVSLIQPMTYLQLQQKVKWTLITEAELRARHIRANDIVIFQRTVSPRQVRYLQMAKRLGKKVVYDIDDNFFAIKDIGASKRDIYRQPKTLKAFRNFLTKAHLVRAGSGTFARELLKYNSKVTQIPYSIDVTLIDGLFRPPRADGKVIIGYAGTSKPKDFQHVLPAILRIMQEYGDQVIFSFMGYVPSILHGHPQVRYEPFNFDYPRFIRRWWQQDWDIGLAPLIAHRFNKSKTEIKFRDYGMGRIAGIYSKHTAYDSCVQNEVNGLLVENNPEAWYQAMKQLIDNPEKRKNIVYQAECDVRRNYSIEYSALCWEDVINNLRNPKRPRLKKKPKLGRKRKGRRRRLTGKLPLTRRGKLRKSRTIKGRKKRLLSKLGRRRGFKLKFLSKKQRLKLKALMKKRRSKGLRKKAKG